MTFAYYSYWSGVPLDSAQLFFFDDCGMLAFPTHNGLTCIAVGGPNTQFHEFRKDIEGNFFRTLNSRRNSLSASRPPLVVSQKFAGIKVNAPIDDAVFEKPVTPQKQ